MHNSKLAGFIIDCRGSDLAGATEFWAQALRMQPEALPGAEGQKYARLHNDLGLHIEVQTVEHDSRVHLDIETDDIPAEVARLEALGATVVAHVQTWCVMQAPTGQKFCVVRK